MGMRRAHPLEVCPGPREGSIRISHEPTRNGGVKPEALALVSSTPVLNESFDLSPVEPPVHADAVIAHQSPFDQVDDVLPGRPEYLRSSPGSNELGHAWMVR